MVLPNLLFIMPKATVLFAQLQALFLVLCAPWSHAGIIYYCKPYGGGAFWTATPCSAHHALLDRTASVPDALPWSQQRSIAEAQRKQALALYDQQPPKAQQANARCAALQGEAQTINARYAHGQWQALETVNADQLRLRTIRSEQSRLQCSQR